MRKLRFRRPRPKLIDVENPDGDLRGSPVELNLAGMTWLAPNTRRSFQWNILPVSDPVSVSSWEESFYFRADCEGSSCWHFNNPSFLPPSPPPWCLSLTRSASRQQQEFLNYPINVEKNIEFGNLKLVVTCLDRLKSSNNVSILQQNIFKILSPVNVHLDISQSFSYQGGWPDRVSRPVCSIFTQNCLE